MARKKPRTFVVVGLGTFGTTVASELARFGNHVLGIDTEERNVARVVHTLNDAVIADGRDEQALRELGVGNYDVALIAIGEDLEANILCTMNVKMLGVKTIWVKSLSRTHHRILSKLGADRIIEPEQEIGRHIAQKLHNPLVRDYVSLGNGFHVVDFQVPESLDGKPLEEVRLKEAFELRALGVMRGGTFISCESGAALLKSDDKLLLLGRRENLRQFGDSL
ncbi:MAG: potassium transporter KtrA [Rhodobacteraceae bacterium]|nr:potassium transporter KtrA [Paracoccaceae bacterium]MAY45267.1 potassium transporter KtrA [Paracoccaceae bacterium]QEW19585.1 Ktr system potassium uptake protein A [Marinibacterium anthonyi]